MGITLTAAHAYSIEVVVADGGVNENRSRGERGEDFLEFKWDPVRIIAIVLALNFEVIGVFAE
ncbi:MAG: hypothetical protein WCO86_13880 [Planctomycetota bacterium]